MSVSDVAIVERLLALTPTIFLQLGTDQLLTDFFREGGSTSGGDTVEKRKHEEQVDTGVPVLSPKWSWPLEHSERALIKTDHRA